MTYNLWMGVNAPSLVFMKPAPVERREEPVVLRGACETQFLGNMP